MKKCFLWALPFMFIMASCHGWDIEKELNRIESYINDKPDSALAALRAIDTLDLNFSRARAKYSLLSAIAYDKNYIDTTDTRVIEPALEYYSRVKDNDHLADAWQKKVICGCSTVLSLRWRSQDAASVSEI